MSASNDKTVAEEKPQKRKKPPGYRAFEKLLKQVVNAPPLKKQAESKDIRHTLDAQDPDVGL